MEKNFVIRSLTEDDIPLMHKAFIEAFSDYPIDFTMTEERFRKKFVEKLDINLALSGGAFYGATMAGFIFTSVHNYQGALTAYNGGTGVVPSCRGHRLTGRIYEYLKQKFTKAGIEQCVLEVLTTNKPACKVYRSVGFQKSRFYRCFRLQPANFKASRANFDVYIATPSAPDWESYRRFGDVTPSFLDQLELVESNQKNEAIWEARLNDVCAGFVIYERDIGRISQIGVNPDFRRRGIGTALLNFVLNHTDNSSLTVLNVDERESSLIRFLKNTGFENKVNQHEMILKL